MDLTKLSQKGQVVIPSTLRRKLRLKEGTRFLVFAVGSTIVLRRLRLSEERMRLKQLLAEFRKKAERIGFSTQEIEEFIHDARKVS